MWRVLNQEWPQIITGSAILVHICLLPLQHFILAEPAAEKQTNGQLKPQQISADSTFYCFVQPSMSSYNGQWENTSFCVKVLEIYAWM